MALFGWEKSAPLGSSSLLPIIYSSGTRENRVQRSAGNLEDEATWYLRPCQDHDSVLCTYDCKGTDI